MLQLGFASAILPDLSLAEVLAFAAQAGYDCVEVEDCADEGSLADRQRALAHSCHYLRQFVGERTKTL